MTIRKASKTDIPALNNLLQDILLVHHEVRPDIFKKEGQKFSQEELEAIIADPAKPVFVYEKDGEVLGHLFCQIQQLKAAVLEPIKTLFIDDLCVSNTARGQQIGQQLMDFAVDYAKEIKCHNLTLDVWDDNQATKRFYERQNLVPQKTRFEMVLTEKED
ncbi:N-acetyltransferase family protein [Streptococcus cameli]